MKLKFSDLQHLILETGNVHIEIPTLKVYTKLLDQVTTVISQNRNPMLKLLVL